MDPIFRVRCTSNSPIKWVSSLYGVTPKLRILSQWSLLFCIRALSEPFYLKVLSASNEI